MKYEKQTSLSGWDFIARTNDDGSVSVIPADADNADYQAYLATLPSNSADPVEAEKPKK